MFDKEAEEYGLRQALWCASELGDLRDAFKDGAEFGYNKANEWHDLRQDPNDLPKENGEYWCKWEDGSHSTEHYFQDNGFGDYVIAWCELPKFEE